MRVFAAILLLLVSGAPARAQMAPEEAAPAPGAPADSLPLIKPTDEAPIEPVPEDGAPPEGPLVRGVRIEGLQRIEEDTVRLNLQQGNGVPLQRDLIAEDIRRLYGLGYFEDVRVTTEPAGEGAVRLVYSFEERPIVRSVTFSGNHEIEDEKIQEVIDVPLRSMLDMNRLRRVSDRIKDLYVEKGYNFTQVYAETTRLPNHEVSVHFRIEENLKVSVNRITFIGNDVFSSERLAEIIETKEDGLFSFLTDSGVFKEGSLARDVEMLTNFYLNHGYIKIRVAPPSAYLSPDRKSVSVTYRIEEGPQYFVGDVKLQGELIFDEGKMRRAFQTQPGLPFSRERLGADVQGVSEQYQDVGYAFVSVAPLTDIDDASRIVDLTFDVDKGNLTYINQIRIRGNTKTRDKVIRRELLVVEGQLFDGTQLRRSRERVFALGFFEEVNFSTEPAGTTGDKIDVIIEVKERSTGTLSVGVGFNSLDKFLGIGQVSFGNLLGYGIRLNANAEFGARRQYYTISYTDPHFLDSNWSLGVDVFNSSRQYLEYTQESVGGRINAGYLIFLNTRLYTTYRYEDISYTNFVGGGSDFFRTGATGSLGTSLVRNTKNHPFDPTGGSILSGGVEWADPAFLGDHSFIKYNLNGTWFQHLFLGVVFSTHGEVAWGNSTVGGSLPFTERYFLGGITSLRGYNYRQVGPRLRIPGGSGTDVFQPVEIVQGGNKMAVLNSEITFPILPQAGIKGVLFFDAGNAWAEADPFFADPLRMGAGFGFRWFSPLGPLRFEWGYPINRRPDERPSVFEFSIGTFF